MYRTGRSIRADGPFFLFRPRSAVLVCGATGLAILAWLIVEIRENPASVWIRIPIMALIGLSVFAGFGRPAVTVDTLGVRLANVLFDVWVPYGALAEIEARYALTLIDREGRRYRAWAAPAARGRVKERRDDPGWWDPERMALPELRADAATVAAVVAGGRRRHRLTAGVGDGGARVQRRPVTWLIVAWLVAALATVAVAVLG